MDRLIVGMRPPATWTYTIRNLMSKDGWDDFRRSIYKKYGYKCAMCGAEGKMFAHEIYEYDHKRKLQIFTGATCLCQNCHDIRNLNFISSKNRKRRDELIKHYSEVNACTPRTFTNDEEAAALEFIKGSDRSKPYKLIIGLEYYHYITNKEK